MGQGSEGLAGLGEAKEQVCDRIPQQLLPTFKSREGAGEVEEYDGSYDCLICCESVRRMHALACSRCTCNPFHQTCHESWARHAKVALNTCPQCAQPTVVPFTRAR